MQADDSIPTTGTLIKALHADLFEVSLRNGKIVKAHLHRALRPPHPCPPPGSTVTLSMTPYDFDQARIDAFTPPS